MAGRRSGPQRRSWWNYFNVEQDFKQRQIVRLLVISALNVGVSTAAFVAFMNHELSVLRAGMPGLPGEPSLMRIAIVWAALMGGLGGLFALFMGILMTHRMAGPIYAFKKELRRIEEGHAPRHIGVRQGDEFHDVAEALNGALEALYGRSGASEDAGAVALELEELRAAHREILDGLESVTEPDQLGPWKARLRALSEKREGERLEG